MNPIVSVPFEIVAGGAIAMAATALFTSAPVMIGAALGAVVSAVSSVAYAAIYYGVGLQNASAEAKNTIDGAVHLASIFAVAAGAVYVGVPLAFSTMVGILLLASILPVLLIGSCVCCLGCCALGVAGAGAAIEQYHVVQPHGN